MEGSSFLGHNMEGSSFLGHNMEGSSPSLGVRKGAWTEQEDVLLKNCIQKYGEGKWHQVPSRAGLKRCRKSCRLRWLNYLRPNIKRGEFTDDEVDLIIRLHKLLGNRWTMIAGRLPGRTANDVKNYWNTNLCKKMIFQHCEFKYKSQKKSMEESKIIKPQPRTFSKNSLLWLRENVALAHEKSVQILQDKSSKLSPPPLLMPKENTNTNNNEIGSWWESLLVENKGNNETDTPSISWLEDEPITARLWDDQEVPAGEETTKVGLGGDVNLSGQNYCDCESSCLDIDIWSLLDLEKEMVI